MTNINIPTLDDYREAVRKFLADSAGWYAIDPYRFYTTGYAGYNWKETCDNAHGGLDLSWAFYEAREKGGKYNELRVPYVVDCLLRAKYTKLVEEIKALMDETAE